MSTFTPKKGWMTSGDALPWTATTMASGRLLLSSVSNWVCLTCAAAGTNAAVFGTLLVIETSRPFVIHTRVCVASVQGLLSVASTMSVTLSVTLTFLATHTAHYLRLTQLGIARRLQA